MIRGAIEIADPKRVVGWMVSSAASLRGKTVLAFSGEQCVGSGMVEVFRGDLLRANLGDGYAGFDFPIALLPDQDAASVVVRLENSDAAILQAGCEVVRAPPVEAESQSRLGGGNAAATVVAAGPN